MRHDETVLRKDKIVIPDLQDVDSIGQIGYVERMLVAGTGLAAHLLAEHIGQDGEQRGDWW